MRAEFQQIVGGWTLIDGLDDLTDRIERAAVWADRNGQLLSDERATIEAMINTQIARGFTP